MGKSTSHLDARRRRFDDMRMAEIESDPINQLLHRHEVIRPDLMVVLDALHDWPVLTSLRTFSPRVPD
jgi:hypothetical protein